MNAGQAVAVIAAQLVAERQGALVLVAWSAIAISPFTILFGVTDLVQQAVLVNLGLGLLLALLLWRQLELARSRP